MNKPIGSGLDDALLAFLKPYCARAQQARTAEDHDERWAEIIAALGTATGFCAVLAADGDGEAVDALLMAADTHASRRAVAAGNLIAKRGR